MLLLYRLLFPITFYPRNNGLNRKRCVLVVTYRSYLIVLFVRLLEVVVYIC